MFDIYNNSFFGFFPSMFFVMFVLIFVLFIVTFLLTIIRNTKQWNENNHSPKISVEASVVAKRTAVDSYRRHHHDRMDSFSHSTSYYVTFEFESKDRSEFLVSGNDYGMLAEGDFGKLTFQGTRYLGFERKY